VWFVVKFFSSFQFKTIPFHAIFEACSWNLFLCRLLSNIVFMNNYTDMTDEEYNALDEELTVNPPKIISNGSDWLSQREIRISGLKNMTVQYLLTKAKLDMVCHNTQATLDNLGVGYLRVFTNVVAKELLSKF